MMYYWERFLDEDQILDHLRAPDSGLHECRGGEGVEGMIATYPSYRCEIIMRIRTDHVGVTRQMRLFNLFWIAGSSREMNMVHYL